MYLHSFFRLSSFWIRPVMLLLIGIVYRFLDLKIAQFIPNNFLKLCWISFHYKSINNFCCYSSLKKMVFAKSKKYLYNISVVIKFIFLQLSCLGMTNEPYFATYIQDLEQVCFLFSRNLSVFAVSGEVLGLLSTLVDRFACCNENGSPKLLKNRLFRIWTNFSLFVQEPFDAIDFVERLAWRMSKGDQQVDAAFLKNKFEEEIGSLQLLSEQFQVWRCFLYFLC